MLPIHATELYDYTEDPLEQKNLSNDPQYKPVVTQLSNKLFRIIKTFKNH